MATKPPIAEYDNESVFSIGRTLGEWKRDVRNAWVPRLYMVTIGAEIFGCTPEGYQTTVWEKVDENMWRSGGNVVSTMVLCRLHDSFTNYYGGELPVVDMTYSEYLERSRG